RLRADRPGPNIACCRDSAVAPDSPQTVWPIRTSSTLPDRYDPDSLPSRPFWEGESLAEPLLRGSPGGSPSPRSTGRARLPPSLVCWIRTGRSRGATAGARGGERGAGGGRGTAAGGYGGGRGGVRAGAHS